MLGDTAVPNAPNDYIAQLWGLPSLSTTVNGDAARNRQRHRALPLGRALVAVQPHDRRPAVTTEMQRQTVTYAVSAPAASSRSPTRPSCNEELDGETDREGQCFPLPLSACSPRP